MEGDSLAPLLKGKKAKSRPIFMEHEGNRAIRDGNWKLVALRGKAWELYDIEKDRTELNNLAEKNPGKVKELDAEWETIAKRANVPFGNQKKN